MTPVLLLPCPDTLGSGNSVRAVDLCEDDVLCDTSCLGAFSSGISLACLFVFGVPVSACGAGRLPGLRGGSCRGLLAGSFGPHGHLRLMRAPWGVSTW